MDGSDHDGSDLNYAAMAAGQTADFSPSGCLNGCLCGIGLFIMIHVVLAIVFGMSSR